MQMNLGSAAFPLSLPKLSCGTARPWASSCVVSSHFLLPLGLVASHCQERSGRSLGCTDEPGARWVLPLLQVDVVVAPCWSSWSPCKGPVKAPWVFCGLRMERSQPSRHSITGC